MKRSVVALFLLWLALRSVCALSPGDLARVKFDQHPGQQISRDLVFRDENNLPFRFSDHLANKPAILVLGYYRCPMLCTLINDGLIQALQELRLNVGRDFQVVDLSIDPTENVGAAAKKKSEYLRRYGRAGASEGWHCLVGDTATVARLSDEVGYRSAYDAQTQQYAHPSGLIILTPDGKISRYLFGVNFDPKELLAAILAAKQGESSSVVSKVFLLCFHYNPITGKYGPLTMSILRIASIGFVAAVALSIFFMARKSGAPRIQPRHADG